MYKKVIILSIVLASVLFGLDKLFGDHRSSIPDPDTHIRMVFQLLVENDKKEFEKLVITESEIKKINKEQILKEAFANPVNFHSIEYFLNSVDELTSNDFYKSYHKQFLDNFEEVRDEIKDWSKAEIKRITWKLIHDSDSPFEYGCNAKIYFEHEKRTYCLKYKYLSYRNGRWYAGNLVEIDDVTPYEYEFMPDMYQEPQIEEYIDYEAEEEAVYEDAEYPQDESATED